MGESMTDQVDRRSLLRRFMVDRRRRVRREEVGLPPRRGDRGGISQEDLADLIKYGAARVGEFERGEVANPTPGLLDAIAGALRMTGEERRFLWHVAAGVSPPVLADVTGGASGDDEALRRLIDGVYPHPAFLMDTGFRLQAYNAGFVEWLYDPDRHPEWQDSIPLWMFGSRHARHVFVDWPTVTSIMMARIRSDQARQLWHHDTSVVGWPATRVMRVPGHTDPEQRDDRRFHVTVSTLFLHLPREGDERLLVIFQLPPGQAPPAAGSEQACAACRRAPEPGAA